MEFVGIDKMSILDYTDKISCVLFSKACNFRCPFCHNGKTVLETETEIPFDQILKFLDTRRGLIDAVVISGGEPTLMPDLIEKIIAIKNKGFLIKLDTNGSRPDVLEQLINEGLLDYVAMDIKNSLLMYPRTTNTFNTNLKNIEKSIKLLCRNNIKFEFRTTLVKEFHSKDSIIDMGNLIKGAPILYLQKFVDREGVLVGGLHEVPLDEAKEFKTILEKFVDKVELRGY